MEIKRFLADNVREGMLSVRSVLGADAVILSNRRIGDKIEILATNEFEAESLDVSTAVPCQTRVKDNHRDIQPSRNLVETKCFWRALFLNKAP